MRTAERPRAGVLLMPGTAARRRWRVVERNLYAYRDAWIVFLTGFLEPVLFLLSIGVGVGALVAGVEGPGGRIVDYDVFVAPGLLAVAAMNGAALDTTFNFFVKYKYMHTYDAMLATPVSIPDVTTGEVTWSVLRGGIYSAAFLATMAVMGLTPSWWALLALPGALLIAYAFAGAGLAATTYLRSWVDFDFVNLALIPMFLFSATFFPLSRYPDAIGWIVRFTPLYQGVSIERALTIGEPSPMLVLQAAYLALMGWGGTRLATRRLARMLQP